MTEGLVLAADVGRTTARLARYERGRRAATAAVPSGASLADPDGVEALARVVEHALPEVLAVGEAPDTVSLGATGAAQDPDAAAALARRLHERLGGCRVVLASDVVMAHAGGLGGDAGVLTIAGTGAVALAVAPDGAWHLVDGAGWLLGDAGGAVDVGRRGLAAALRHHDGRAGGSPRLHAAARDRLGPVDGLAERIQGDPLPARAIAAFAPEVARAADEGDEVARRIWERAAADLADTTLAACRALPDGDPVPVAFAGPLFDLEDLVAAPVRARVTSGHPRVEIRRATADALEGAFRLAAIDVGVHHQLLLRIPATGRDHRSGPDRVTAAVHPSNRREEA